LNRIWRYIDEEKMDGAGPTVRHIETSLDGGQSWIYVTSVVL